ncbi:MAG: MFS transporter, partial [Nocardioides sp.]
MSTPMTTPPRSALAEPTVAVPRLWVVWISLASIGVWAGFFGPIQVLLAQQAEAINESDKESI